MILLMTTLNWTVLNEPSEETEVEEVEEPVEKGPDVESSDKRKAGTRVTDADSKPVERR